MNEELGNLDIELKSLFVETKLEEVNEVLNRQPDHMVKELAEYSWNVIKKYYDTENFNLIFQHFRFVAYTCFLVEYARKRGLITEEAFGIMMEVYNDIYEAKRGQRN